MKASRCSSVWTWPPTPTPRPCTKRVAFKVWRWWEQIKEWLQFLRNSFKVIFSSPSLIILSYVELSVLWVTVDSRTASKPFFGGLSVSNISHFPLQVRDRRNAPSSWWMTTSLKSMSNSVLSSATLALTLDSWPWSESRTKPPSPFMMSETVSQHLI